MAGDWLKMEANTPEKEEVLAITARMGWDDCDLTVGKLFRIWRWFDQQTTNGNAARVTKALLDRIVGVTGFCDAMHEVGWLEIGDAGISLPKFDRHNGTTAKSRALTAKRVANHKANGKGNDAGNAQSVSDALPKEEKRREEVNTPHTPQGGKGAISLKTFLADCKANGEKPIPEGDTVFAYADETGIPMEFLRLHWLEFKERYSAPDAKRYKDWRSVHRKSVRGNWFRIWYIRGDECGLTTQGEQAKRHHGIEGA